jgi:DNA-binding NarL/FixJ family response regulator
MLNIMRSKYINADKSGNINDYSLLLDDLTIMAQNNDDVRIRHIVHKLNRLFVELDYIKNSQAKIKSVTNREKEIIHLLAKGFNNPEIATKLFISRRTVEQHRKNINRKLQITCFADLLAFAYAFNII